MALEVRLRVVERPKGWWEQLLISLLLNSDGSYPARHFVVELLDGGAVVADRRYKLSDSAESCEKAIRLAIESGVDRSAIVSRYGLSSPRSGSSRR